MGTSYLNKYGFYWKELQAGVWTYWDYIIRKVENGYQFGFWGPGSKSYVMVPDLHQTFEEAEAALDDFIKKLGARCGC